jgi:PhzF family phenazine biosynthesis protein
MLAVAATVGYAETAFVTEPGVDGDPRRSRLRYFSPIAEVPFCGHATIALAVALSARDGAGSFTFDTPVGPVLIETAGDGDDITASFTGVEPQLAVFDDDVLADLLGLLGVGLTDIDPAYPPRIAYSGNWHPVLVFADSNLFDSFAFDPETVRQLMDAQGWAATVAVLHRIADGEFEARNLFPVGAITEDPATGAAAAAVGAYLRLLGLVEPPSRVLIHQGRHVGRPSLLTVDIPAAGGIVVRGTAVRIPAATGNS